MECKRKLFKISYQHLLGEITQSLGWVKPVYNKSAPLENVVSIVVHPKGEGPLAYFFEGKSFHALATPEEVAAEKGVHFLVENRKVLVLDFNLRKRDKNEACLKYYRAKKERLGIPPRKRKLAIVEDYNGVVSIDFCAILEDVLKEYVVPVTNVECVELSLARNRCFFAIQHTGLKIEWVMSSSCITESLARQNLAKKALKHLQPLFGFEIEDLSYHKMLMAGLQCSSERESYLTVKERTTGIIEKSGTATLAIVDGYKTPVHEGATIRVPGSPPPVPKKPKRVSRSRAESFASVGGPVCLYNLPDDLSTIFTVTGRM